MNISNYLEFINESFDSSKLSAIFNYVKGNKSTFLSRLKQICEANDIKLSYVNDDMFQYVSYVELSREMKKSISDDSLGIPKPPFYLFGFNMNGDYRSYDRVNSIPINLDNLEFSNSHFFLIFSYGEAPSKITGLSQLRVDRIEAKTPPKETTIFDKLGEMNPEDVSKIAKQLKRIFGGEYPLFYLCYYDISIRGRSNFIQYDNLNQRGEIKRIHDFNVVLIKKLAENRKNKHVIKFLQMNEHIKKKLESFFIEGYDDISSYIGYLSTIIEVCDDYNINTYIKRLIEYDTFSRARPNNENMDTALKIIKKL